MSERLSDERPRLSHKQLRDTIKDAHKHIDRYAELLGGEHDYGHSDSLRGCFDELIAEIRSLRAEVLRLTTELAEEKTRPCIHQRMRDMETTGDY